MPVYEYQCSDCGLVFEELVRSSDERIACPRCGSEKTERRISLIASTSDRSSSSGSCGSRGKFT